MQAWRHIAAGLFTLLVAPVCTVGIFWGFASLTEAFPTLAFVTPLTVPCVCLAGVTLGLVTSVVFGARTWKAAATGSVVGHLLVWLAFSAWMHGPAIVTPIFFLYGALVWLGYWVARAPE